MNFAHITEADIGLAKYREMNVVRFSVAACGKEHCVTTQKNVCVGDQRKMPRGDYLVLWYC